MAARSSSESICDVDSELNFQNILADEGGGGDDGGDVGGKVDRD